DLAVQCLDRHAVPDEELREVIEQLRMTRPLAVHAEIARRVDEARAEVLLPDPIHDEARSNRLPDAGLVHLEAATALRKLLPLGLAKHGQKPARNLGAL